MNKAIRLLLFGITVALLSLSGFGYSPAGPRARYNFNTDWKLFVGDPDGAQRPDFDDALWKSITAPHPWNEDDAFSKDIKDLSTGIVWYRKHFKLPLDSSDKKIFIEFEGIRFGGEFYLNGKSIGQSDNGVMAFRFDITDQIVPGDNILAARIDNMSGLTEEFRPVKLENPDLDPKHRNAKCIRLGAPDIGHEGASLFRANGRYYLGAADDYEDRYSSVVAIADNVYGPYRMRHEAVPSGGGTNYFKDKNGDWWCAFFGNDDQVAWREKPRFVRIDFAKDGKVVVARDQPKWLLYGRKTLK